MTKIYFNQLDDTSGDPTALGGFAYFDEQQANQARKAKGSPIGSLYSVREFEVKYAHRNGELESPTVEGYYWIEDSERDEKFIYMDCLEPHWREKDRLVWTIHDENPSANARYWGPIPMPEIAE